MFLFLMESCYVFQTGLKLTIEPRVTSDSGQQPPWDYKVCHHTQLDIVGAEGQRDIKIS